VILIVDASIAVKWGVAEPQHDRARRLIALSGRLAAPDLLLVEVGNTARRKVGNGEIGRVQGHELIRFVQTVVPVFYPSASLVRRAYDLALALEHPIYDCIYLVCAELLAGVMVSADQKFVGRAAGAGLSKYALDLADPQFDEICG
jgi:predicted nucleic acid-binding protein